MRAQLDDAKAHLLARVADVAERRCDRQALSAELLAVLIRRYYWHAAPEDLIDRDSVDLFGAVTTQYRLGGCRLQGTATVVAFTPTVEEHGWAARGHTVVQIITDDMPFLVDSVTAELSRQNRGIHVVIHPQLIVRRDIMGNLLEIVDSSDPDAASDGSMVESWMSVEIDRDSDPDALHSLESDLRRVLSDVREAVEDWAKMRATALRIVDELTDDPLPLPAQEVAEASELLRWLTDDRFTFLGYRQYDLAVEDSEDVLRAVPGTGLGILRADKPVSTSFSRLTAEIRRKAREERLLTLTKANSRSTVHRPAYLDYIGLKRFDPNGEVVGERRFLGLYTAAAYTDNVTRTPVIKRKVAEVLARSGLPPMSHGGRDLLQILESYPRDEMFQISVDDLFSITMSVLHLQERRKLRLFLRREGYGRFFSALVYLPRDRYTTEVRFKLQDILMTELGGCAIDYTAHSSESVLTRLHFVVRVPAGEPLRAVDAAHIERLLAAATRSWSDDFADALVTQYGEERAAVLRDKYATAIPDAYREDFQARIAVPDLQQIEGLAEGGFAVNLYQPLGDGQGERRFKIYRVGPQMSLSDLLPVLQRMGLEVIDERPYQLRLADGSRAWIYDFGLNYDWSLATAGAAADAASPDAVRERFQDAFAAVWSGAAENDGFNALVLLADLSWRQVTALRAYAKYLRQTGTTFTEHYIQDALVSNPHVARRLVDLFEVLFDPEHPTAGSPVSDSVAAEIDDSLDQVASLDQDRILRSFLALIQATLRTNYFQRDATGRAKPYLSLKIEPRSVPGLPEPRPEYEIFVYSPRFEGVHLRFGAVARGGLRWSDRREDFRTEILGLVKAQMVKNAVIVPAGAKGGFVLKRPPDRTDREALRAEAEACYSLFVSGLLDLTDNVVSAVGRPSTVVPPPELVRRDGDDPYLVVAADKGTATFSDIANEVAQEYGFWLGDAFASGGSAGYDHKAMGITARGAWTSVERHFRELGCDIGSQNFTVIGVGDMSGDVFGNGMLLSRNIRLLGAFDHRHIFLDPDPDPAVSYGERERLFAMPRSSWADYDSELISAGGGVHPRSAKSIAITPQVRQVLNLPGDVATLTPVELLRAILAAPADLLWNGGIGTYVKASTESNAEVGDKANDAIRIDGKDLRCRVVGEGGNLGLTQLGRVEFALAGGKVNTDAIDNSAGVDCSDHEVNIKILLDGVVDAGDMTPKQRNELLAAMTDEVADLVLRDNYRQNVTLAAEVAQAHSQLDVHARYMHWLEHEGRLDRALEFLPRDRQLADRRQRGTGLTQPELAVLLAYTKITLEEQLLGSGLTEDPYLHRQLYSYFPAPLRERFAGAMDDHPLRREIISTCMVNDLVNDAGIGMVFRLTEETGAPAVEIARAYSVARAVYDLDTFWTSVERLDNAIGAELQTRMRLEARRLAERATLWLLTNRRPPLDVATEIEHFSEGVADVVGHLPKLLRGDDGSNLAELRGDLVGGGVPDELAAWAASMPAAYSALDIVQVSTDSGYDVAEVADVYFDVADRLNLARLLGYVVAVGRDDRWKAMARAGLRDELYAAHAELTVEVLSTGTAGAPPSDRFEAWKADNTVQLAHAERTLDEIVSTGTEDLTTVSVALRVIRTLLRTGRKP